MLPTRMFWTKVIFKHTEQNRYINFWTYRKIHFIRVIVYESSRRNYWVLRGNKFGVRVFLRRCSCSSRNLSSSSCFLIVSSRIHNSFSFSLSSSSLIWQCISFMRVLNYLRCHLAALCERNSSSMDKYWDFGSLASILLSAAVTGHVSIHWRKSQACNGNRHEEHIY